ncbi:TANK-binding kinase 1-binding protein 1 [Liparis tanakae]|uniref:TANK-binding kinase 1-binding protein 1 n=1 Tax=Liparis tanakae TaxID=230148 RepID=A0A4Z2HHU8_9TELE|nr:TANK-binding kinase 1-binding protein 1 [Liparis tanakae]
MGRRTERKRCGSEERWVLGVRWRPTAFLQTSVTFWFHHVTPTAHLQGSLRFLCLFLVNLALAYTELTEELGRLQALSGKQTEILRKASQEHSSPAQRHSPIHHQRHSPVPQRHSPISQRHSPVPPPSHHSPIQQRRSPVLQRLSPDMHRRSPLLDILRNRNSGESECGATSDACVRCFYRRGCKMSAGAC